MTNTIKNSIQGAVTPIDRDTLYSFAHANAVPALTDSLTLPGTDGCVVFENLDFCSPEFGHRTFVVFGPQRTYKTLEELCAGHLGDVPSRFEYATRYYLKGARP